VNGYRLLSLLLQYPDEELLAGGAELEQALAELPENEVRAGIASFLASCDGVALGELQAGYVATFDFDRRASLHLTYHTHGDRRQRGIELVRLKRRFAAADLALADGELPDYLPALPGVRGARAGGSGRRAPGGAPGRARADPAAGCTRAAAVTRRCSTRSQRRCPR